MGMLSEYLEIDSNRFVATEKLEDLSSDFFRNMLIGGAQLALPAAYIAGVYMKGRPDFGNPQTYLYYYVGVFVKSSYVVGKALIERSIMSTLLMTVKSWKTNRENELF